MNPLDLILKKLKKKRRQEEAWEKYIKLSRELDDRSGNRRCKLCGKINTHRLNSTCPGDWEPV